MLREDGHFRNVYGKLRSSEVINLATTWTKASRKIGFLSKIMKYASVIVKGGDRKEIKTEMYPTQSFVWLSQAEGIGNRDRGGSDWDWQMYYQK